VEATTALSYGLAVWLLPVESLALHTLVLLLATFMAIAAVVVIVVSDLKYYLIPNGAILLLSLIGIALSLERGIYISWMTAAYDVGFALIVSSIPALLWLISRGRWMGLGDAKLFLALSLIVGFPSALASFLISFWAGALVGILLILTGKSSLKARLPFAPFIALGTVSSLFWGQEFLELTGISVLLDFML